MTSQIKNIGKRKRNSKHWKIELLIVMISISITLITYLIILEAISDTLRFDLEIQYELIKKLITVKRI